MTKITVKLLKFIILVLVLILAFILWYSSAYAQTVVPRVHVYESSGTTMGNAWAPVSFEQELFDEGGWFDSTASTTILTVPETGLYEVGCSIRINEAGNNGVDHSVGIFVGSTILAGDGNDGQGIAYARTVSGSVITTLTAGDILRCQSLTGTAGTPTSGNSGTNFWAYQLAQEISTGGGGEEETPGITTVYDPSGTIFQGIIVFSIFFFGLIFYFKKRT